MTLDSLKVLYLKVCFPIFIFCLYIGELFWSDYSIICSHLCRFYAISGSLKETPPAKEVHIEVWDKCEATWLLFTACILDSWTCSLSYVLYQSLSTFSVTLWTAYTGYPCNPQLPTSYLENIFPMWCSSHVVTWMVLFYIGSVHVINPLFQLPPPHYYRHIVCQCY